MSQPASGGCAASSVGKLPHVFCGSPRKPWMKTTATSLPSDARWVMSCASAMMDALHGVEQPLDLRFCGVARTSYAHQRLDAEPLDHSLRVEVAVAGEERALGQGAAHFL